MLASCSNEIKFHDWETTNCYGTSKPCPDKTKNGSPIMFTDLSWSSDGSCLSAVQSSGSILLLKPNISPIFRSDPFVSERDIISVAAVKSATFSKTQTTLIAIGSCGGHVLHHNLITNYSAVVVEKLPGSVNYISYGAGDSYLSVACSNGQIFIIQAGIGVTESYFVPCSDCVSALATHPTNSKYLAGGSSQGVIAVWDVNASRYVMQHNGGVEIVDIAFSPTNDTITAISGGEKIGIYDIRIGECVHEKIFDVKLTTLAYSPRGTDIAVGTAGGHILSMDKRYLRSLKTGLKAHDHGVKKLKYQFESSQYSYLQSSKISRTVLGVGAYDSSDREPRLSSLSNPRIDGKSDLSQINQLAQVNALKPMSQLTQMSKLTNPVTQLNLTNHLSNQGDYQSKFQLADHDLSSARIVSSCQAQVESPLPTPTPTQQAVGDMSRFHIVDERSLMELKQHILKNTGDLIEKVMDQVNNDFLKMRMNVSKQFCNMELQNRNRWQEFNDTLLKIACLDDRRGGSAAGVDDKLIHEAAVRDTTMQKIKRNSRVKEKKASPSTTPTNPRGTAIDDDISEEHSYYDNMVAYSDHIIEQQEVELDEVSYENDITDIRSLKQTIARVQAKVLQDEARDKESRCRTSSPATTPSTKKDTSPRRHVSKLPRHQGLTKRSSSNNS